MELNREQAIEILDRIDFFQGQRAGRELWNSKPFDVQEQDIAKFSQDVAWLKNYIKELTEENERLKAQKYYIYSDGRIEMIPTVDTVRADTVRKMQEMLHEQFHDRVAYTRSYVHDTIDLIAKEMIEEC